MDHFRRVVEQAPQAVAAEFTHHAVAELVGVGFNRRADVAQPRAGFGRRDAEHQAFVSHLDQLLGLERRLAGVEHPAGIAVPAVNQRRDVDVENIAILQHLVARNAVTDHMVDRDARAVGIAAIAERGGDCAGVQHHAPDRVVDAACRHPRAHQIDAGIEDFGGEAPGFPHPLEPFGRVELDGAVAVDGLVAVNELVFVHGGPIATARAKSYFASAKAALYSGLTAASTLAVTGSVTS